MDIWNAIDNADATAGLKEFTMLPEGQYKAEVTDVEIKEDIFQISLSVEFTITEGEMTGRKCWMNSVLSEEIALSNPTRLSMVKAQICKLAGTDTTGGEPAEVLAGCKGNTVSITIKHNPSKKDASKIYANVYVNEKLN